MNLKNFLLSKWTRWAVSVTLVSVLLWISDVGQLADAIGRADLFWLLAAYSFAMGLTAYGAIKWWVLMPRSRSGPATFVRVNFISNFVGIFFPGIVGIEAARIAGITRHSKDLPAAFASVLVDRVFGLLTLAMMVAFGGIFAASVVPSSVKWACVFSLAALLTLIFALMSPVFRELTRKVLPDRLYSAAAKVYECLDLYRSRKPTLILSLFLSLLFQLLRVVMVYFLTLSLDLSINFSYLAIVVPIALFVQMIPISVYGIGIRESAMVSLLAVVGVSTAEALALSLLLFAIQIAGALPGAVLFAMGHKLPTADGTAPRAEDSDTA